MTSSVIRFPGARTDRPKRAVPKPDAHLFERAELKRDRLGRTRISNWSVVESRWDLTPLAYHGRTLIGDKRVFHPDHPLASDGGEALVIRPVLEPVDGALKPETIIITRFGARGDIGIPDSLFARSWMISADVWAEDAPAILRRLGSGETEVRSDFETTARAIEQGGYVLSLQDEAQIDIDAALHQCATTLEAVPGLARPWLSFCAGMRDIEPAVSLQIEAGGRTETFGELALTDDEYAFQTPHLTTHLINPAKVSWQYQMSRVGVQIRLELRGDRVPRTDAPDRGLSLQPLLTDGFLKPGIVKDWISDPLMRAGLDEFLADHPETSDLIDEICLIWLAGERRASPGTSAAILTGIMSETELQRSGADTTRVRSAMKRLLRNAEKLSEQTALSYMAGLVALEREAGGRTLDAARAERVIRQRQLA